MDYDANEVLVAIPAADRAAFAVDRYVCIFNSHRSGMFRIVRATPEGEMVRLELDQTALLGEGPAEGFADGAVTIGAQLLFANGSFDELGNPLATNDFHAGAWLGEGSNARQLKGIVGGRRSTLILRDPVGKAELEALYGGQTLHIWQYGRGDQVEVPRLE